MRWTVIILIACTGLLSCRSHVNQLPEIPPAFIGRVALRSFSTDSGGPSGLLLMNVESASLNTSQPSEAYFRIDMKTTFVVAKHDSLMWLTVGLPQLSRAYVRVWLSGEPTSKTTHEIWGRARIVVVDSQASSVAR